MKTIFKILIGISGLVILLFTQCRKKPQKPNISDWLEKEYPNRFQVLDTYTDDIIRNLSFSIKHSIVAEKSNPLVQAKLHWNAHYGKVGAALIWTLGQGLGDAFDAATKEAWVQCYTILSGVMMKTVKEEVEMA